MNRTKKLFFTSILLFNSMLCSYNAKGMDSQNSSVVEIKAKHDVEVLDTINPINLISPIEPEYIKLATSKDSKISSKDFGLTLLKRDFLIIKQEQVTESEEKYCKYKYCLNSNNSYLDSSYAVFCDNCLSEVNFDKLVVSNNQLPDSVNYDKLKLEEKLGFKIFYLMLANICIDWLIHNKEINEIYDKGCNNDVSMHELANSAKKLEDLNSNYVSNYIKESLINGRKSRLWRDGGDDFGYYQSGILFDDNIFLSSDLEKDIIFPCFSCDYDEKKATVTFRFFKKTEKRTQPMMIVISESELNMSSVGIPNYEIFFYDEYGCEFIISGNYDLKRINTIKSTTNLLFT